MNECISDAMKFFQDAPKILENATVYTKVIEDSGRYYHYRYYAKDRQLVEQYAKNKLAGVDKMRSPSLSCFGKAQPMECNGPAPEDYSGYWFVDLKYYGLD